MASELIAPEIVDLSLPLEEGMLTYPSPSHQRFEANIMGRLAVEGRVTRKFTMGSHCGTHVDAMSHFQQAGLTAEQLPVNQLTGKALLLDLGELAAKSVIELNPLKALLRAKKAECLVERPIERLVIRTDWSRFWHTEQDYKDWAYFCQQAIEFLISEEIKLLALDFPSPDAAYFGHDCSLDCPNHKLLFAHNIILVEYLTNLSALVSSEIFLMVNPLKLVGFDGAPARVTAYSL